MFRVSQAIFDSPLIFCDLLKTDKYVKAYTLPEIEFRETSSGVKYREIKLGDGAEVRRGDFVNIQLTGSLLGGREIETTRHRPGGVIEVEVGGESVVKGVSEGLIGMREYGTRELLVPPALHYPDRYPNQIMKYDVMVRRIVRSAKSEGRLAI